MASASPPRAAGQPPGPLNHILLWLRRHMSRLHGALAALATLGVLGAVFAFLVFGAFALAVARGLTQAADEQALRWVAARRTPLLDFVMLEFTTLGNIAVMTLVAGIAAVFLWATHHRWSVLLLALGGVGGVIINTALKAYFDRARPDVVEAIASVMSPSFPSGHAMNSLVVYGSVAYIVGRLEPTRTLRRLTWGLAAIIVLAIGTSRVYLGVHYPSDVLAGFLAGAGWLVMLPAGMEVLRYFNPSSDAAAADHAPGSAAPPVS